MNWSVGQGSGTRTRLLRSVGMAPVVLAVLAIGAAPDATNPATSSAIAQATPAQKLPAPPANGEMGFVIHSLHYSVIQEKTACPLGLALGNKEIYLESLPVAERERLLLKENERELGQKWVATVRGPNGTNICSQPDMFPERPMHRMVQSKLAWGINLDDDEGDGSTNPDSCVHENFNTPAGDKGIDNQAYRAMGCTKEWRGVDGISGDVVAGFKQFVNSGEFTQVLLLRGVDSLVNDDNVEVIYGNTPDRPVMDSAGKWVWNVSYTVSDKKPRYRNALRGKIVNGVLMTEAKDMKLAQTWGQGGIRGTRTTWTFQKGRLKMAFQPDGTLKGVVAGYQPMFELIQSTSFGGTGAATQAGADCAGRLRTLNHLADGIKDPKTGKCTGISNTLELQAIPAFVNDVQPQRIASK